MMKRQFVFSVCSAASRLFLAAALLAGVLMAGVNPSQAAAPGAVVGWGYNGDGQLNIPAGLNSATAIAGGTIHSLALKSDGTVIAWGCLNYDYGQCNIPAGLTNVTAIAANVYHNLALKSDGTVVVWGENVVAQWNVPPAGLNNVTAIAAGLGHSLALKSDGTVVAWGNNYYGQLNIPAGLNNVVAIAAKQDHSLALKSDGTVVAWGNNSYGQLNIPAGLSNVIAIASGNIHSLALKSDGTVVAWGNNSYGQLNIPAGLSNVTAIAAGGYHNLTLKSDGAVVAWGYNCCGQTNVPAGLIGVTAMAAGATHSLALLSSDTTPPVITANVVGTPGSNGWYVSDVTVSWSVVDNESAITSQSGCGTTSFTTETAGATSTCTAASAGGTASQSVTIKLDKTAPIVDGGPDVSIIQGNTYAGAGTFSDSGPAAPWTATVDYGDGSGVQSLALAGNTLTLNHVYAAAGIFTAEVAVADEAGNLGAAAVMVTALTPREGIEGLIEQVQTLIPGSLNDGQGNALIAKLEAAIRQLDKGNVATALNQLEAFVNQVNAMISSGVLSAAEGQPLIDAANAIIAALGG
jgi:hypothetical protein